MSTVSVLSYCRVCVVQVGVRSPSQLGTLSAQLHHTEPAQPSRNSNRQVPRVETRCQAAQKDFRRVVSRNCAVSDLHDDATVCAAVAWLTTACMYQVRSFGSPYHRCIGTLPGYCRPEANLRCNRHRSQHRHTHIQ